MYYCGIDVGKRSHMAIVVDDKSEIVKEAFRVTNDRAGFAKLTSVLNSRESEVQVALEATGHYWLALFAHLTQEGYEVVVLNPLQVSAFRRTGLRKRKTDASDAYWIASLTCLTRPEPTSEQKPVIIQLRDLSRFRFRLVQQIGDCKRKIIAILDRVFPEYESLFSDVFLRSSRALLREGVSAEELAELDLGELSHLLSTASRGHFGEERARQVQETAQRSVGVSFLADALRLEVHCLLDQMELLEKQIGRIEQKVEQLMEQVPSHVTTIPGVGSVTGAMLIAEIGDVDRFDRIDKLVAYTGIDPTVYESSQFRGDRMHMSKRGSTYLRWALWQAARSARRYDPELRAYYNKKLGQGKPYGVAMGAVCRKLLARVYVILKEQRPYEIRNC